MYIPPPALLIIAISLSYLVSILFPMLQFTDVTISFSGVMLITLGASVVLWAASTLRKHKTTLHPRRKPRKLVMHGPYTFSRNPIYLGFLMISLGTVLLFANVLAFLGPLLFFGFISMLVIPFEETMLTKTFGTPYKSYRKKIRRWL